MTDEKMKVAFSTPQLFEEDKHFTSDKFSKIRIAAMHSGVNVKGIRFRKEVIEAAKDTFSYIPVLADVATYTDKDGKTVYDYTGHAMHIEEDAFHDGQNRIIYDERIVGIVPENPNFKMVYDKATDRDYVYVDAYIYKEYGNYAYDILKARGGNTSVSMELDCFDMSVDEDENCINVGRFNSTGITLLGSMYNPGMEGANAQIKFSAITTDEKTKQIYSLMEELKESIDLFLANNDGGEKMEDEIKDTQQFEENQTEPVVEPAAEPEQTEEPAQVEETTVEESDEETTEEPEQTSEIDEAGESEEENADDEEPVKDNEDDGQTEDEPESDENEEEGNDEEPSEEVAAEPNQTEDEPEAQKFSFERDGIKFNFEISYNEIAKKIYENLGEYQYIEELYQTYAIIHDYEEGKNYKTSYSVGADGEVTISGKQEVFRRFLTQEEISYVENMAAEQARLYSLKKDELFNSKDYSSIANTDEYNEVLASKENFSVEEISSKLDGILLNYVKSGKLDFSAGKTEEEPKKPTKKLFTDVNKPTKKVGRYGSLFVK